MSYSDKHFYIEPWYNLKDGVYIPHPLSVSSCVDYSTKEVKLDIDCIADDTGTYMYSSPCFQSIPKLDCIKKVIQSGPYTIIIDTDGNKTKVKCEKEKQNDIKGLVMCLLKYSCTPKQYHDIIKPYKNTKAAKRESEVAYGVLIYIYGQNALEDWICNNRQS